MNKKQWLVLGIGSILLSGYMFRLALGWGSCMMSQGDLMISCVVRKYAHAIPAIIFQFLGWIFIICGFLEGKKKK